MLRASRFIILAGLFALPFIPLYVAASLLYPYVAGKGFAFRMITEVIFAAWILLAFGDRSYRPRSSAILWALVAFVAAAGVGNLLGVDPGASFWGDLVRMDGYLSLLHWLALFLVAGSFLAAKGLSDRFLGTTVIASTMICLYSLVELVQNIAAGQPRQRLEATFGNPTFLGTYVLVQLFVLAFLTARLGGDDESASAVGPRHFWGWPARLLIGLHIAVLFLSGTRGAVLGLVIGAAGAIVIVAAIERRGEEARSSAREAVGALLIVIVGFFLLEMSDDLAKWSGLTAGREAVQSSAAPGGDGVAATVNPATGEREEPSLSELDEQTLASEGLAGSVMRRVSAPLRRMANIGTGGSVQIRLALWEMAQRGFWDRPLTGWGQENFDVVADQYYLATFPSEDEWADRPHNTALEWFVSGGVIAGLAYLAVFLAAGWVIWKTANAGLSITQKSVLTGLLCAYLVNNLFLFDMVPSYLAFFSVLAYLHALEINRPAGEEGRKSGRLGLIPVAVLLVIFTTWSLFSLNVRPILAARAGRRAVALLAADPEASLAEYRRALGYRTFADSAIRERLLLSAVDPRIVAAGGRLAEEFAEFAEDAWKEELTARPERSRARAFMGVMLQESGEPQRAIAHLERAVTLSPTRRGHYFRLADVYQRAGQAQAALEWAARGYALDPSRRRSRLRYATAAVYAGRDGLVEELLLPVYGTTLVRNEQLARAYIFTGRTQEVIDGWRARIRADHLDLEARRNLAEFLLLAGRNEEATTELRTLQLLAQLAGR